MELSIIIVNFNTAKITLQCIKSIEKYPFTKGKFEVILVENGSSDESEQLLKKFSTKKFKYKFIKSEKNLGFAKGNNLGLKNSSAKFKLLLNSDTKVIKNSLDNLYSSALDYEKDKIGIVGARLLNEDGSIQPSVFRDNNIIRSFKQYWLGINQLDKYYPKTKTISEVEVIVFAAVILTPLAIEKVGLLNEKYFMYFEDFDYCRSIRKAGLKILYNPNSQIYHLHGASGNSDWRRLIPSSKIYHGKLRHYLIFLITWAGQKIRS